MNIINRGALRFASGSRRRLIFGCAALLGLCISGLWARARADQADGHHHMHGPPGGHGGAGGPHGAMSAAQVHKLHQDLPSYIAAMESPERDAWQKPDALLSALHVRPDAQVGEIGAGPGYFTRRLARLARAGWVWAVDVEPRMVTALHQRLKADGAARVTTVLAPPDDPMLPEAALDLVLIVDTYHHLSDRPRYLARLGRSLRPGGRIVIVDFHKRDLPVGPPLEMKLSPEEIGREAQQAGLQPAPLPGLAADLLPHQYVVAFSPRPAPPAR